jgi:hypothetical protein
MVHTDIYDLYEPEGKRSYVPRAKHRFDGSCYRELFWGNRITVSSTLIPRSCLERVGQFDERIRGPTTQDYDLWIRIARRYSFGFINEPLVVYRRHSASGSQNQRMMLEDEYYVLAKALEEDPELLRTLGARRVAERMSRLAFLAAYSNIDANDLRAARLYLRAALSYDPQSVRAWAFWISTFLPRRLRENLRYWKGRIAGGKLTGNGVPSGNS